MIEKTNQVKMFKASAVIGEQTITANVKEDMTDNLLSIDSGIVTNHETQQATFYLYEGGTLSITCNNKNNLKDVSQTITDFINQLTPTK